MHLFSPQRRDLYGIGFAEADGSIYALFDEMADLVACAIRTSDGDSAGRARLERLRREQSPDVSGGVRHVTSNRHSSYLHLPAYRKAAGKLRKRLGWGPLRLLPNE
jgi:hypothetical protein